MSILSPSDSMDAFSDSPLNKGCSAALLKGEILLETRKHSAWGGAVTAQMYLPSSRSLIWPQLTDYPRWVHYFPDVIRSEVLHPPDALNQGCKRLYQVANKAFLFLSIQVEAYLRVVEIVQQQIQFRLEKGSFVDFSADLSLQDYADGTLLTYAVQATPTIPVPSLFIEQAMQLELPANMRKMRQVLCGG
ncbi:MULTISPECIES: SRPBCC family protein [Cyanophyceae]|uniref:SRPBCC family protein n=1 Tax=Cyanophyceae TaxID=3028117 RepID=UPI00168679E4|nr:SRPBCC family protein [Trichocoleus sp. FACHB-40]MBD2006421.1 cyclase [Trichocoleus sp. FACHB-40]